MSITSSKKRTSSASNNEGSIMEKRNKIIRVVAVIALFTMIGTTVVSMSLGSLGS